MSNAVLARLPQLLLMPLLAGMFVPDSDLLRADLSSSAPSYSAASVVNAATQTASGYAPNSIVTVYGKNLSYTTRAVAAADIAAGSLPIILDQVRVVVNGIPAPLFFISPTQINFLIPPEWTPGDYQFEVFRQGAAGPPVTLHLDDFAPAFFVYNGNTLIATHADGRLITTEFPAASREIIVLYAGGLGVTTPKQTSDKIPTRAAALPMSSPLKLTFDGVPSAGSDILYAGITPGCSGLYQINVRLPAVTSATPAVQIQFGNIVSPLVNLAAVSAVP